MSRRTPTTFIAAAICTALLWAGPAQAAGEAAPDFELCKSQLELLISGGKLTSDEAEAFKAQCDCLAEKVHEQVSKDELSCVRDW